jgi:hypothetical protein
VWEQRSCLLSPIASAKEFGIDCRSAAKENRQKLLVRIFKSSVALKQEEYHTSLSERMTWEGFRKASLWDGVAANYPATDVIVGGSVV